MHDNYFNPVSARQFYKNVITQERSLYPRRDVSAEKEASGE
jgi:hypothetical protein